MPLVSYSSVYFRMQKESDSRASFFQSFRKNLEEATTQGYSQLQTSCLLSDQLIKERFSDLPFLQDYSVALSMKRDKYSTRFLPKPWSHVIPLQCLGDGNCLFRAVSILCCGSEVMHTELRVRTVCELVNNESYYLQPDIVSIMDPWSGKEKVKQVLPAISANFNSVCISTADTDFAQEVFRMDCQETATDGTWCNMWHIHGLASVIRRPIMSIYPEVQDRIRPSLHRKVFPRMDEARDQPYCMVMWTRTHPMRGAGWEPNHFVPCFDTTSSESKQSSSYSHSHNEPGVKSRCEKLNSAKSLRTSGFYSKESRKVPTKPLNEANSVGNPTSTISPPSSSMDTFESVSHSYLKPSISSRVPIDVLKSCTWINARQEHFQTVGSLVVKDDRTSMEDEISSLLNTNKLLPTGSEGIMDPYEDFHETQSNLSSCYSNNKSLQSVGLPIVTTHLPASPATSPPNETITAVDQEEPATAYCIDESLSISQPPVTCSPQTATLTTNVSSFQYSVLSCDIHSHNTLLSVTSLQSGSPAASCASPQCHTVHHISQENFTVHDDRDSSPPNSPIISTTVSPILCSSLSNITSSTSHLQVPTTCASTPNETTVEEQYSNGDNSSIPRPLVSHSDQLQNATLTTHPDCDIHSHYTPFSVTSFQSRTSVAVDCNHSTNVPYPPNSPPISTASIDSPVLCTPNSISFAASDSPSNQLPVSVATPKSVKPTTISPSTILMRYSKPKKKVTGNTSLMKWATIVSSSHKSSAELPTEDNSKPIESDDNHNIMISPIHSPASYTFDTSDIFSMTPPEAEMYDTSLHLFYSDDEDA